MNIQKKLKIIKTIIVFSIFTICLLPSLCVYSHPGRTDENGGHYDYETGEYHYHHGYPAHQHIDGVCPYDYDDKTGENSGSSSSSGSENIVEKSTTYITTERTTVAAEEHTDSDLERTNSTTSLSTENVKSFEDEAKKDSCILISFLTAFSLTVTGTPIIIYIVKKHKANIKKRKINEKARQIENEKKHLRETFYNLIDAYDAIVKKNKSLTDELCRSFEADYLYIIDSEYKKADNCEQRLNIAAKAAFNRCLDNERLDQEEHRTLILEKLEKYKEKFPNEYYRVYLYNADLNHLAGVPKNYIFEDDKLYCRKNGKIIPDSMLVYTAPTGKAIHRTRGCHGAWDELNIVKDTKALKDKSFCLACCNEKYKKWASNWIRGFYPEWYYKYFELYNIKNNIQERAKPNKQSFFTKLENVTKYSRNDIRHRNRQTLLKNVSSKTKVRLEYLPGKRVYMVIDEQQHADIGELSLKRSEMIKGKIAHIEVSKVTGGEGKYNLGCNVKVTYY